MSGQQNAVSRRSRSYCHSMCCRRVNLRSPQIAILVRFAFKSVGIKRGSLIDYCLGIKGREARIIPKRRQAPHQMKNSSGRSERWTDRNLKWNFPEMSAAKLPVKTAALQSRQNMISGVLEGDGRNARNEVAQRITTKMPPRRQRPALLKALRCTKGVSE